MNKEQLIKKIEDIEWEDFEVKEAKYAVPKNSWQTVSAFSNTAGGWVIFGVSKSGKRYKITKIDIPFKLNGTFRDENPPQLIAVREALVNLLMHSDYFSSAKPRIRTFIDRIEFFNPGALPKAFKYIIKEDFSMPRNPVIAKIFRIIKLSENIGSGFHKMLNGWESYYKIEPEIEESIDQYKITFKFGKAGTKEISEGAIEGVIGEITNTKKEKIVLLIKTILNNEGKRVPYYQKETGISGSSIERYLKQLKEAELVYFSGEATQVGGYYITKKLKKLLKTG